MHIVVCGDIAYPTISGVSRISAKGVLQGQARYIYEKIFALELLKFLKSLIINCKARAIQ